MDHSVTSARRRSCQRCIKVRSFGLPLLACGEGIDVDAGEKALRFDAPCLRPLYPGQLEVQLRKFAAAVFQ